MGATADPLAGLGTPVGAPPPVASGGADPLAGLGTPVGAPPAANPLTANPKGEGLYQMQGPNGTAGIPYSNVETAKQLGYQFGQKTVLDPNSVDEEARYTKDRTYGPGETTATGRLLTGAAKSAVQVPNTIAGWLDRLATGLEQKGEAANPGTKFDYKPGSVQAGLEGAEEKVAPGVTQPIHGGMEHTGGFVETLAEWLFGEGESKAAFEALPMSQRMTKLSQAAGFLEKNPAIAEAVSEGLKAKALRIAGQSAATGAAAGTQSVLHGGTPAEAMEAAATGGVATGVAGVLGEGITAARTAENTRQVTAAAHEAAPGVLAERTAAEGAARQAAAQQGVKDVAARATGDAFQRFNAGMAAVPGFTEAVAPAAPKTFAEGSEALKEVVRPLYQKADAEAGYNGKLQDLMTQHAEALKNFDYKAADKAEIGVDGLLENRPVGVTPAEQTAMRQGWRDAKVLDKIHAATEGAFNGISEDMAAEPGTSARVLKSGTKEGGSLQLNLGRVLDTPAKAKEAYRVLGRDGVANLYRASNLVSNPEMAKATAALAEQVAQQFPAPAAEGAMHRVPGAAIGTAVGGAVGAATHLPGAAATGAVMGGAAGAALSDGARDVMRKMVMSPRVGQLMDFAVRNNVSPKIAAAAVAAEIQREQGEQQGVGNRE